MKLQNSGRIVAVAACALLLSAATVQAFEGFQVSQYLSGKRSGDTMKATNPTQYDMYVIWIAYDEDGLFDDCEGEVIEPRGNYAHSELDESDGVLDVLAVPSEGSKKGKLIKDGIWARDHKGTMTAMDPRQYKHNADDTEVQNAHDCICTELDDDGVDQQLFKKIIGKITCP